MRRSAVCGGGFAIAAAMCVAVCVPGVAAAKGSQRALRYVPVRVLVAAGSSPIPLTGARVRLLDGHGKTIAIGQTYGRGLAIAVAVAAPTRTSGLGAADFPTVDPRTGYASPQVTIPGSFTVVTSGGFISGKRFRGTLAGQVTSYGRRTAVVIVNPETTLSVMYCQRHHRLSAQSCGSRVARFFQLPRGSNLGQDLLGSRALDGRALLTEAGGPQGLPRYLTKLVTQMGHVGATHPFRSVQRRTYVVAPIPELVGLERRARKGKASLGADWWDWLNRTRVVTDLVTQVAGWAFSGGGDSDAAELASINSALNQISNQLTNLQDEIDQLVNEVTLGDYAQLAGMADPLANGLTAPLSAFQTETAAAQQISCYPSTSAAPCANPKPPSEVCAGTSDPNLQTTCTALGVLPAPPSNPVPGWWTIPGSPQSGTLIGRFMNQVTTQPQPEGDSELASLAQDIAFPSLGAPGVWQFGSAYFAAQSPFLGTGIAGTATAPPTGDQVIQDLVGYYMSAYTAGLTMRGAYWGFDQDPSSEYPLQFTNSLNTFHLLLNAAPQPLPAGTIVENSNGVMWSGQLGALLSQPQYNAQVSQGARITLPLASNSNNGPGAQPPTLAGATTPISDWSVAQNSQLTSLYHDVPSSHSGTPGDYLTTGTQPLMWPGLVNNGVWDARAISDVGINYWAETLGPPIQGMLLQQTPDKNSTGFPMPILDVVSCTATGNQNCLEPTWDNGAPYAAYDLNNGVQITSVVWPGEGNKNLDQWKNWDSNQARYVYPDSTNTRTYPGITTYWTLPVLYYRMPVSTGSNPECYYYWPETNPTGCA